MQCYTELIPPTAVNTSISLPLLSATANNLVIARSSLIQIYAIKSVLLTGSSNSESNAQPNGTGKHERKDRQFASRLILIAQYHLSGTVTGLGRLKTLKSKSGGELLLVALRDAKLSLLQWDPERHGISTVSIHYYERDDLQGSPFDPPISQCPTQLTVDPGSRCAAFHFGARKLAILPFHQAGDELAIDDIDDGDTTLTRRQSSSKLEDDTDAPAPYSSSFVLSLLTLDPTLQHPIDMAFLYGYREPTLAILSSRVSPSTGLLAERRDTVNFTVYTLDLEQKASTSLLSVTDLPSDVSRIIPLPTPVGGALLVGSNEFIHVDQSGKIIGVAVNEFAQEITDFPLVLQHELDLKLEGCSIEQMVGPTGQLLIILTNGRMAILTFKIDGRTVSGLSVELVLGSNGGDCLEARPSCTSLVGRGRIFVGSEDADSVIVGWSANQTSTRQRPTAEADDDLDEDLNFDDIEDENDLYSGAPTSGDGTSRSRSLGAALSASDYNFRIHDRLVNLAPLKDIRVLQQAPKLISEAHQDSTITSLDLIASTGKGKKGNLSRLRPKLHLNEDVNMNIMAQRVWSIPASAAAHATSSHVTIVTSTEHDNGPGSSRVYRVEDKAAVELIDGDFEPDAGSTVDIAAMSDGSRVVQVLSTEVRTYDEEFSLNQIWPLYEDPSDDDPKIISASFAEPYVLLIRDDNTVVMLKENDSGELERLEKDEGLAKAQWQSGTLFDDIDDAFHLASEMPDEEEAGSVLLFLLGRDGSLQIFRPPNLQAPLYVANGLGLLPPFLTASFAIRRSSAKETLKEILVAHLGDSVHQTPYLVLRSVQDDIILYQPFQDSTKADQEGNLQFLKVIDHHIIIPNEEPTTNGHAAIAEAPMRAMQLQSGIETVFVPGLSPRFVIKTAATEPMTFAVKSRNIRYIAPFMSAAGLDTIIMINEEYRVSIATLPPTADYSTGWVVQHLYSEDRIVAYDYHATTKRYVLATSRNTDFRLPQDDELHQEWREESTDFLPTVEQDTIKLLDATTSTIVDTIDLEPYEVVTCVKSMSLEVSEVTHERKELIGIGTALVRGEDLQAQGCIYIYDVIEVVPELGRPETGRKLKLLAKIKDKGAVTQIMQVGTEGFVLVAHGQKCFVRGLKEDGTLLPVAFMDTQCYVSVAKELRGTNLCMLGDVFKGLWFVGYTEEPYGMKLFGKGANHLEVLAAEYLPFEKELLILVLDAQGDLYTYRFDPEHPKSLDGHRLLQTSTFHAGVFASSMTLLPRTPTAWDTLKVEETPDPDAMFLDSSPSTDTLNQLLIAGLDGRLALITPLSAAPYRALTSLQSYLTAVLPHPLGLNPKAYRATDVELSLGGRGTLDGNILRRWMELGTWRRSESLGRFDVQGEWEARALLDAISGSGLGFL